MKKNKIFDYTMDGCEYKAIYFNDLNKKEKMKVFKADPDSQDFGEPEIKYFLEEKFGPMIDTKTFKIIEC